MNLTWIVIIIVAFWWFSNQFEKMRATKKDRNTNEDTSISQEMSEDGLFKIQTRFEKRIELDLPGSISGQEKYIYYHLIRAWFDKLSAQNRYNNEMTQTLRKDFWDYMKSLENRSTYNYLWLESEESADETGGYREMHINESKKAFAIEAAFAAAIGKEAVSELAQVRSMGYFKFNRFGEMAPKGFECNLEGQFVPEKKTKKIK